ncbi:ssk1 response regulator receiver [Steccherinum ochraceum]|uniref:Ssk1 response regulator receiver n=1 Tax=Steccherinum ochraceum TaxID=92696 RepID=A0A4R0RK99_9APHY|nr:ssk1 response regulator receiver [Steccherinum ochraceum]
MPETRLPAVRIPTARPESGNGDELGQDAIVVDLPPSSKFAIAWPADSSNVGPHPLTSERTTSLSSSESETDMSEEEPRAPQRRATRTDGFDDSDFVTPTSHLNLDQDPIEQASQAPSLPRLSRAFSMPLPSQLSALQNPRRLSVSPGSPSPGPDQQIPDLGHFQELSLELADSVQTIIQTLLQLSPPQILDPAKEQYSACTLSIPTPSVSAIFTSMKNLNYMSANMAALNAHGTDSPTAPVSTIHNDFDIGEVLQSVGDSLSGMAAQVGIDLVLFHGDVGMKHVAVKGDVSGISYTLSHIIRQVVGSGWRGDSVEIGLYIDSATEKLDSNRPVTPETGTDPQDDSQERTDPSFSSHILRRLLRYIGATLDVDSAPRHPSFTGFACEVNLVLDPGDPSVIDRAVPTSPESFVGYPEFQIAQEPTLEQLTLFADSLRGKKATLHATTTGPFAHHLSSYLTAWGMDVSHVSTEPDSDNSSERAESTESGETATTVPGLSEQLPNYFPSGLTREPLSFVLIDDDVQVLRSCLLKAKAEQAYPLSLNSRKRPSLASNHRPKSSPQVARVIGPTPSNGPLSTHVVIIHFTSLSKFKLVKDAIQSILTPYNGIAGRIPEVIVIPKPAGPRRFLTALHTAVTKPVVDPFFVPIATSPSSPGMHAFSPFGMTNAPRSPGGRSSGSLRTASDRSNRSPKEHPAEGSFLASSPLGGSDRMEYFSDAAVRMGTSPSTGLVIQSPDGQPAGIFFHPKGRPWTNTPNPERAEGQRSTSFLLPAGMEEPSNRPSSRTKARAQLPLPDEETVSKVSKGKAPQPSSSASDDLPSLSSDQSISTSEISVPPLPGPSRFVSRRSSQASATSSPPMSPQARTGPTSSMRRAPRRQTIDTTSPSGQPKKKGPGDANIVPPISVLIVDDNPIEQTILSTFMKKKKIKYDVAKNGEEAVNKWRTGVFHLILMDIQMPVMDGIQATKEIRRLEKLNSGGAFPSTPQSEGQQTPSEASTTSQSSLTPSYRSSVIIVALTASSLQADRVAALAAGCNDFLTKPVTLEWLNGKIIEWGSIKALQMWADIRPDVVKTISSGQAAQAQNVARRLHVPEGRSTPTGARSRSSSLSRRNAAVQEATAKSSAAAAAILAAGAEKPATPDTPLSDDSPGQSSSKSSGNEGNSFPHLVAPPSVPPTVSVTAPTPKSSSGEAARSDERITDTISARAPDEEALAGHESGPPRAASEPTDTSPGQPAASPPSAPTSIPDTFNEENSAPGPPQ